jgi:hypothetical protein
MSAERSGIRWGGRFLCFWREVIIHGYVHTIAHFEHAGAHHFVAFL